MAKQHKTPVHSSKAQRPIPEPEASPYPLPFHCATIWTRGGTVFLAIPPAQGKTKGHTLQFPASPEGLATALLLLKSRETSRGQDYLATAGAPDQALVIHQARHQLWAARGCPHCAAEGRFAAEPGQGRMVADGTVRVRLISPGTTAKQQARRDRQAAADLGLPVAGTLADLGL